MEANVNNEILYQKIYDLERALNAAESMKDIMQQEIDSLQIQLNNNELNFQENKKKIETELTNKWMQKVTLLQTELDDEREISTNKITHLKEKITSLEKQQSEKVEITTEENVKEKFHKQLEENIILKDQLEEMRLLFENSNQEKIDSDIKIRHLEKCYEETNKILECKKTALIQANEALQEIKDEKALLANEIGILKAEPVDEKKRGNSLFAEVDDNRKVLIKNIALLKNKLTEAKIKLSNKSGEVFKLRTENDKLYHKIQEIDKVLKPEQLKLIQSYKSRIQELELLVCKLEEQEVEPKTISNENQRLNWLYNSLEKARNETRLFQKEYKEVSRKRLQEAEQLMASQQEIRNLIDQLTSIKLKYQESNEKNGISKADIQGREIDEYSEKENNSPNRNKTSKEVRFSDDVK